MIKAQFNQNSMNNMKMSPSTCLQHKKKKHVTEKFEPQYSIHYTTSKCVFMSFSSDLAAKAKSVH